MASLYLVVGLGNPGAQYTGTRHNLGFEVVDKLAAEAGVQPFRQKFHALIAEYSHGADKAFLLKPQTFMNRSGLSVSEAASFFKIPPESILVINDDLDLPAAQLRLRTGGGAGGHNGMQSVIDALGTENFPRIRIGIGRPDRGTSEDYVLGKIPSKEAGLFKGAIELAAQAIGMTLEKGFPAAMNQFNRRVETT